MSTPTDAAAAVVAEPATLMTYREAINAALDDALAADGAVLLMGEDVGADGGVFKTNSGLIEKYGPERVRNTPICENGFLGVALGMSLVGLRPIVEIMFADFLPSGGDALVNQLPKYRFMSGGQTAVPVTVRAIGGATGRFGTQHSATGESWFMHLPGLRVVTAGSPGAAYSLLRAAIDDPNPVIFYEHKGLYGRKGPVIRGEIAEIGKAAVLRAGQRPDHRRHPADGRTRAPGRRRARAARDRGGGHRPALAPPARPADGALIGGEDRSGPGRRRAGPCRGLGRDDHLGADDRGDRLGQRTEAPQPAG